MNTRQHILGGLLGGALLVTLCGTAASVAAAGTDETVRTLVVHYGDLNLSRQEGVQKLYSRIRAAATRVCSESGVSVKSFTPAYRKCRNETIDVAVTKVNNGILTALHQQQKPSRRFG